jgi:16S rRNA (guanine527-N7)-methyltransferase
MDSPTLYDVLLDARDRGLLGPGPVEDHIAHAEAFAAALGREPRRVVDLGSGAGVPGLVLAVCWPSAEVTLLDAAARRVAFLERAIVRLEIGGRVRAEHARAEVLGRSPNWRAQFDVAVARAFGPPPVVAECAAPLLEPGGRLIVSEPPENGNGRWPTDGVALLGLEVERTIDTAPHRVVLRQAAMCPDRFPRRPGVPRRRPLF